MNKKLSIAVVGGGIAGITSAYLLQKKHNVTLYEKNNYVGGHTNTVKVSRGPDQGLPIDTGFIVMNDKTYPLFRRFLSQLNVETAETTMSFSYFCKASGLEYGSSGLNSIMAQRKNILSPGYWKFLVEITRFFKIVRNGLESGSLKGITLGEFVQREKFSSRLANHYLLPMSAAIWSASDSDMQRFPMESFARFYENHGLLSAKVHPQWFFVKGGSQTYVRAFLKQFTGTVHTESPIRSLRRNDSGISLALPDGSRKNFDSVVIAAHADEALAMLEDASETENRLLSPWRYSTNKVYLHDDESYLPPNLRARSSWNTIREPGHGNESPITLTYDMSRLQKLNSNKTYCVTLNPARPVPAENLLESMIYTHPVFDFPAIETQTALSELNGKRNTWFCGSYFGYGFHEDAVRSSVAVARKFGVDL